MANRECYLTDLNWTLGDDDYKNIDNDELHSEFGKGPFVIEVPIGRYTNTSREIEFKKNTAYSILDVLEEINDFYYSLVTQEMLDEIKDPVGILKNCQKKLGIAKVLELMDGLMFFDGFLKLDDDYFYLLLGS